MVTIVPGTIVTSWTRVLRHATVATLTPDGAPYGLVADGAVALAGDRIAWVGASRDLPTLPDSTQVDALAGALVTPGLVDCHTHLVWAGNRHREFEQRLLGASYADIARAGGGILSSVRATRAASEDELLAAALPRARALLAEGVTCIEVKSGYGLDVDTELRQLRVARRLAASLPLTVRTTLLAAHAVPPEFAGRADDYVDHVCDVILPAAAAAGLADAVDAFCEDIGFSAAQVERLFHRAAALGLPVKLHAEQLSNQHGAALAARFGALSADHLEWLDEPGARSLAAAGSVAVLLPAAFYWLRETRAPPVDVLRRERVPMAVATDLNPGSAPVASLLLAMNMACVLFRLTAEEALAGVTREAARALGLAAERGTLEAGKAADLVAWDAGHPSELVSQVGLARPRVILRAGVDVAG
ncbi:MAG: imidazolonepropionase [Gammaproteobacteria bacterium]|jgi:imidazolonepropionase|nr:imidazolonepropionase [Gammaproteobacteria bacterium]